MGKIRLLENMPFGIRVANLLPDPYTGRMWISIGQWIRIQEGNGIQKSIMERLKFFLKLGDPLYNA